MAHNRLGVMGNYYGGMLDMYTDLTKQIGTFGGHIEVMEVDELSALREEVSEEDLTLRVAYFREVFQRYKEIALPMKLDARRPNVPRVGSAGRPTYTNWGPWHIITRAAVIPKTKTP